jgi:hypothetical protein
MREDRRFGNQRAKVVVGEPFDLGDLMRGAEAVEEMQERDCRFARRGMSDRRQVVRFLD